MWLDWDFIKKESRQNNVFFINNLFLHVFTGYGLDSDFKMFIKTFPFMEKTLAKMQRVVDLERLAQKVRNVDNKNILYTVFIFKTVILLPAIM